MTSSNLRRGFACLAALFILLTFVSTARAQSAVDGAVGGNVLDSTGAVVPNASVTVRNIGTNAQQQAVTDGSGYFRVIHLQPGVYEVKIEASGFDTYDCQKHHGPGRIVDRRRSTPQGRQFGPDRRSDRRVRRS